MRSVGRGLQGGPSGHRTLFVYIRLKDQYTEWMECMSHRKRREKLSNSQVCCLAQLCLAAAWFLSISCATCTPSTLYSVRICHIILMPSLLYTHHHDAFYGNKSTPICAGISTPRYLPWRWSATRCRQECFRPTDAIEYCTASVVILIFRPTATATVSAPQS